MHDPVLLFLWTPARSDRCDWYVCADGVTTLLQKLMMIVPEETDYSRQQTQRHADDVGADIASPD